MNWEALGAISEAAGTFAILVSLIYVAVQIRQNTQEFKRSVEVNELAAFERNIESANRSRELLLLHPEVSELMLKGFNSLGNLQGMDKFRFGMLLRNILNSVQAAYIRQLVVDHDSQQFEGGRLLLDDLLIHPGVREWLEGHEPDWRPEFRALVAARLEAIKLRTEDSSQDVNAEEQ
jgi:hypothetical protein